MIPTAPDPQSPSTARPRGADRPRGALFDEAGLYRYTLWRTWDAAAPRLVWVMLNPSLAGAEAGDPTIRRCENLARGWGYGGMECVNLFAWRTPHPAELKRAPAPVGPDNDAHLLSATARGDAVAFAWGNHGAWRGRDAEVLALLADIGDPLCLGLTRAGHPRHPLYVRRDAELVGYRG